MKKGFVFIIKYFYFSSVFFHSLELWNTTVDVTLRVIVLHMKQNIHCIKGLHNSTEHARVLTTIFGPHVRSFWR